MPLSNEIVAIASASPTKEVVRLQPSSYTPDFGKMSDLLDSSVVEIDLSKTRIQRMEGDLGVAGVGVFSPRAVKNLCKWLSIPKGLMLELTEDTLNKTVQEQMLRRQLSVFRIGYDSRSEKKVAFVQPRHLPYLNYSQMLAPVEQKAMHIKGNPVDDDILRFFFRMGTISVAGHELIVGQNVSISSICVCKATSLMGLFRTTCTNSLQSTVGALEFDITSENMSSNLIGDIINAQLSNCSEFAKEAEAFVQNAVELHIPSPVETVMDGIDTTRLVPKTVTKRARFSGDQLKTGQLSNKIPGLDALDTLWDYTNLLTWEAQSLATWSSRTSAEKGIFSWATMALSGIGA